jgi:D-beta-D-heptose 7-phosphate kinase/D-beta-D-heptose 1-phosphate adenosyltransferase
MGTQPDTTLLETVRLLSDQHVMVVGDVMLDRYLWGNVSRVSPEAPVPVVHFQRETATAGGAGNVARNLSGLGVQVSLFGFIGDDVAAQTLATILSEDGIATSGLHQVDRPTVTKTRVIGSHQQMLRLDVETLNPLSEAEHLYLLDKIRERMDHGVDAIVLSDYQKGVLSDSLVSQVISWSRDRDIPVIVDPKGLDFSRYRGATAISPNRAELVAATGVASQENRPLYKAAQRMIETLDLDFIALTMSAEGIALIESDSINRVPSQAQEVFDVSGAGDTVVSVLAAAIAAGVDALNAVRLANIAAGIVVGRVGTVAVAAAELEVLLRNREESTFSMKILTVEKLVDLVSKWRSQGEKVVFTNGCFDLLHVGHVTYLDRARQYGDRLILGLNTDHSVRRLKGPERPLVGEQDRARVLASLASVDAVVLFDEETPIELIEKIQPDYLAKGADYREDEVVGGERVKSWGGEVILVPLVSGKSTSSLMAGIKERSE